MSRAPGLGLAEEPRGEDVEELFQAGDCLEVSPSGVEKEA